jgi:hypothetical protein
LLDGLTPNASVLRTVGGKFVLNFLLWIAKNRNCFQTAIKVLSLGLTSDSLPVSKDVMKAAELISQMDVVTRRNLLSVDQLSSSER